VAKLGETWQASISIDGKMKHLGTFDSEEAAARKFDEAAAPFGRAVNFLLAMEITGAVMVVEGPLVAVR
jgi:hypothetical protein